MNVAMILAAGRGERLRPITDLQPKALCNIGGIPLIEHHLIQLARAGFDRVVINHAYLGGQIRQQLGSGVRFGIELCYAPEPPGGLETGGGIVNALPLLGKNPFLTVNADILTDFNVATLKRPLLSAAHLVLVKTPDDKLQSDFGLSMTNQRLQNFDRRYTFTGIACYDPALFINAKPGRYSVTPLLRRLANEGRITGELHAGLWMDIGTPDKLRAAQHLYTTRDHRL